MKKKKILDERSHKIEGKGRNNQEKEWRRISGIKNIEGTEIKDMEDYNHKKKFEKKIEKKEIMADKLKWRKIKE